MEAASRGAIAARRGRSGPAIIGGPRTSGHCPTVRSRVCRSLLTRLEIPRYAPGGYLMSLAELFYAKHPRRAATPRRSRRASRRRPRRMLFEALEPRLLLSSQPLSFAAAAAADLAVRLVDDITPRLEIVDNSGTQPQVLASQALADTSAVEIQGSSGNDRLTIDASVPLTLAIHFAGGAGADTLVGPAADSTWHVTGVNAGTVGNVTFTGVENLTGAPNNQDTFVFEGTGRISGVVDGGTGGFDTLVLASGQFDNVAYTITGPDSGTIDRDGDVITYAGLEPTTDATGGAKTFTGTAGADTITVTDSGGANEFIVDIGVGEDLTFTNASAITSLTIDALGSDDTIVLNALDANFNGNLIVNAGDGNDTITVNAVTGSGTYTINGGNNTDTIVASQNGNITLTDSALTIPSGTVSLTASTFEKAVLTDSGAGGHTLNASGFSGDVTLTGGGGGDTLRGGTGDDRYIFANGFGDDTLTENAGEGTDTLDFTGVTNEITVNGTKTVFNSGTDSLTQANPELAGEIDITLLSGVKTQITNVLTELSSLID